MMVIIVIIPDGSGIQFLIDPVSLILRLLVLQEGEPLPGPETGHLSNTWKGIVQGDTCADKARGVIGKGHWVESSRVREPRRTVLPRGLQSRVLW